ncbi:MAG: hypothetical protein AMS22_06170 [Thiotrichales bacterium SG8_50]|nr:MAG: hypothetical protein AMS22_06170 [Thiotrichales bacterium SG8_50]
MWMKEPLVHFLVLGALVFALYSYIGPDAPADDEIVVSRGQQEHLVTAFTRTWQRPPTQAEFTGIVDDWIREEIAYREGQRLGLDSNDTIIRRRLRQKLEVLADEIVSMAEPGEEMLQEYLEDNIENYTLEPVYTLRQVFFNVDERGAAADQDAEQALLLLETDSVLTNPENLGDRLSLAHRQVRKTESELAALFGRDFAGNLVDLEAGKWQGPVLSGYGLHLVLVEEFVPGRPLTLEEAERDVRRDWDNQQRVKAIDTLYEEFRKDYTITIEPIADSDS